MIVLFSICAIVIAQTYPRYGRVVSVYDGDTYTLADGNKIRLRGVNTPELKPAEDFGVEARDAVRDLILGKEVKISYGTVKVDSYGRLIASVESEDGKDVATELLRLGYGHVFLIPPDTLETKEMFKAQMQAKADKKGVWSTDRYIGEIHITSFHANGPGVDEKWVNGEYLRLCNVSDTDINIKGYTIRNNSGKRWEFPDMNLPAGHTIKLHSGRGYHQKNPDKQLEVYLQSYTPIWDNAYDKATIFDPEGNVEDERVHAPKTTPKQ